MSSLVSSDAAASYFGTAGAKGNALHQQMSKLVQDRKSGNVNAAKADSDTLSQMMGGSGGPSSPFASMMSQLGGGMPMGNTQGAGSADFASTPSTKGLGGSLRGHGVGSALNIAA